MWLECVGVLATRWNLCVCVCLGLEEGSISVLVLGLKKKEGCVLRRTVRSFSFVVKMNGSTARSKEGMDEVYPKRMG